MKQDQATKAFKKAHQKPAYTPFLKIKTSLNLSAEWTILAAKPASSKEPAYALLVKHPADDIGCEWTTWYWPTAKHSLRRGADFSSEAMARADFAAMGGR